MKVLFVSSEVSPYSKTGGLADVAGALPEALRARGIDVRTITPRHRRIDTTAFRPAIEGLGVTLGARSWRATVTEDPATATMFIDIPELFDRDRLYTEDPDEHIRFAALGVAALEICRRLRWRPDIIHCNDWQTGLIPLLTKGPYETDPFIGQTPTILTIHNLGYQGRFPASVVPDVGIYGYQHLLHHRHVSGDHVGFLEAGILHADLITTVSPTYAREIQTPEGGAGLHALLADRGDRVVGILNGIDTAEWNPRTDPHLPFRYSVKSLWRKERNKQALCHHLGLDYTEGVPLMGIVSRLVAQKGFDLAPGPLTHFLDTWDVRLAVLGSGDPAYEAMFSGFEERYPRKAAFVGGYDHPLSHLIEAGADIFLMPSLYEPCGLNQMYSLAYGTAPVVRKVGGLADTVEHFNGETGTGNGFVFEQFDESSFGWAIGQALSLHIDRRAWRSLQMNAMTVDHSWESRAVEYEAAYRRVLT